MKKVTLPKTKKHFAIIYNGKHVGDSWAVSAKKACANWWWKYSKCEDEFTPREMDPDDLDAIEI